MRGWVLYSLDLILSEQVSSGGDTLTRLVRFDTNTHLGHILDTSGLFKLTVGAGAGAGACAQVERISHLVGLDASHAEPMQIVQYQQGEEYRMHWDAYDERTELGLQEISNTRIGHAGQRLVTVLGVLRAPESGGETAFQHLQTAIKPKVGRILVWVRSCYRILTR